MDDVEAVEVRVELADVVPELVNVVLVVGVEVGEVVTEEVSVEVAVELLLVDGEVVLVEVREVV